MSEAIEKKGFVEALKAYIIKDILLVEEGGKWVMNAIWNVIRNYSFCVMLYIFNMHLAGAVQVMTGDVLTWGFSMWVIWMITWHGFKFYRKHKDQIDRL